MPRTITSNVIVDRQIADAMIPPVPAPFGELFAQAQKVLDQLSQSQFFTLYVKEKIAEQHHGLAFLRLAHNPTNGTMEWLVLTKNCKLKFLQRLGDDTTMRLHSLEEASPNEQLLQRASYRLAEMRDVKHALNFLFGRFGKPRFSVTDISTEMRHNGRIKVVLFNERYPRIGISDTDLILRKITSRLERLQFEVETQVCAFSEDPMRAMATPAGTEVLFVVNYVPQYAYKVAGLYGKFSDEAKRRLLLWVQPNYDKTGFSPALLTQHLCDTLFQLSDDALLDRFDHMFEK